MNSPIRLAQIQTPQALGQGTARRVVALKHPAAGRLDDIYLRGDITLDFSAIANDRMVLVHTGNRLILIFEDQAMIVLHGFYDTTNQPASGPLVYVGAPQPLTLAEFVGTFPISNDITVLPATGPAAPATGSGVISDVSLTSSFTSPTTLTETQSPTSTLPASVQPQFSNLPFFTLGLLVTNVTPPSFATKQTAISTDEALLAGAGGSGDIVTGKLTYDFGSAGAGSTPVRVDMTKLPALTSDGEALSYSWNVASLTLTATTSAGTVFTLTFTDPATGAYKFTLLGALDHLGTNDSSLTLAMPVVVTAATGAEARGSFDIKIADDVPAASTDSGSGAEDGGAVRVDLLANDTAGADGVASVQVLSVTYAAGATAPGGSSATYTIDSASGVLTLLPGSNWNGTATFTTRITDADGDSSDSTARITITPVNDAPVAGADSYSTDEDHALTIAAAGVLGNDSDVEGDSLTASLVSTAAHGSLTLNANGSFTYTPTANYFGADSFTYKANDGSLNSNTVTVSLTVNPVNDAPDTAAASLTMNEDGGMKSITLTGSDIDGTVEAFVISTLPTQGTLYIDATGMTAVTPATYYTNTGSLTLYYLPGLNNNGSDSFTFAALDNSGAVDASPATASITITPVNDAPVAGADSYSTDEDHALTIAAAGVLGNDSDVEGDSLTASLVSTAAHGSLTLNANGSFTYTPTANYFGADSFTYKANDGSLNSNTVTVSLTVNPVNDAPDTAAASLTMNEDGGMKSITLTGSDIDGTVEAFVISTLPTQGTLYIDATGMTAVTPATYYTNTGSLTLYYLPGLNNNGSDSFTFAALDNSGAVDASPATASITITPVNDAPVAVADSYTTDEDVQLVIPVAQGVLTNDIDVDGNTLTAVISGFPRHGTLSLNSNGSFTYTPTANYSGTDSFFYVAKDASLNSNPVEVTLTVNPVNDAPDTLPFSYGQMNEDISDDFGGLYYVFPIYNAATDIDGDTVAGIKILSLPTNLATFYTTSDGTGTPVKVGDILPVNYFSPGSAPLYFSQATYQAPFYFIQVPDANGAGTISYAAVDSTGLQDPTPMTSSFNVIARPDAPRDITLSASSITENNTAGATVATLGVVDPDAGDTHSYAITGGTGQSLFSLSGTTLKASSVLDYETAPDLGDGTRGYTLTLKVTDNTGRSYTETDTIRINDVVEWNNLLVTTSTTGTQSNEASYMPAISADGRFVAYYSLADNLVSGDTNSSFDIFLHDLATGTTTLVSHASDGTLGNSDSQEPSVSGDGRYVTYASWASNLVGSDTNGTIDIFLTDTANGTTERISVASDGTEGNGYSYRPAISGDGRYVVFESTSTNLTGDPASGFYNIYLHDKQTGSTTLLTKGLGGAAANSSSSFANISEDGHYASFYSNASNLVAGDTNNAADIFRVDLSDGSIERVSVDASGAQATGYSYTPSISADGRYVSFYSTASNLIAGDSNGLTDVFVKDMVTGTVTRVSQAADGTQTNDSSYDGQISGNGLAVVYGSYANNLASPDTNATYDVFLKDLTTGGIALLSHGTSGDSGNNTSYAYSSGMGGVSTDGTTAVYVSYATDLVSGDSNSQIDVIAATTSNGSRLGGTSSGETITGTSLGDLIAGLGGDDILLGGYGDDRIWGDADNDNLTGGGGADRLSGGTGADNFIFNALSEGGDSILDFSAAEGDVIDLLASVFNSGATGAISAANFATVASATADAGSAHFVFVDANGSGVAGGTTQLHYDSNGGSGVIGADRFLLASLENGAEITASMLKAI